MSMPSFSQKGGFQMLENSMLGCNFDHPAFHDRKVDNAFVRNSGAFFKEILIQTDAQVDIHIAILHDEDGSQSRLAKNISTILTKIFLEKNSSEINLSMERLSNDDANFLADFLLVSSEIFKNHNSDEIRLLWEFMLRLNFFDLIMILIFSTHKIIGSRFLFSGMMDLIMVHSR